VLDHGVYFDVGDGRMIFAIPRANWTYFGTTDTNYVGPLEHPAVTAADADYLIGAVNRMFPKAGLATSMIESSWAGIRPLIHEDGKSPTQLSRKDELFFSESGLITIAGGKLTGFRKMAEKVVDVVSKRLGGHGKQAWGKCKTHKITLSGYDFFSSNVEEGFSHRIALQTMIKLEEVEWMVSLFGSNTWAIVHLAGGIDRISILKGTVRYCIRHEGVTTLSDFFVRRTAMLYFGRNWITACLETTRAIFAEEFGTDYDPDPGGVFATEYRQAVTFE